MGICQTYATSNGYHKDYNTKYRAAYPDRIRVYKERERKRRVDDKTKKELEDRENHRATFLLDEYDEGINI